jgi:hypothetical protein
VSHRARIEPKQAHAQLPPQDGRVGRARRPRRERLRTCFCDFSLNWIMRRSQLRMQTMSVSPSADPRKGSTARGAD